MNVETAARMMWAADSGIQLENLSGATPMRYVRIAKVVAEAWATAWDEGHAAAEADALNAPYSDMPEAASWTPTPNPYRHEETK